MGIEGKKVPSGWYRRGDLHRGSPLGRVNVLFDAATRKQIGIAHATPGDRESHEKYFIAIRTRQASDKPNYRHVHVM